MSLFTHRAFLTGAVTAMAMSLGIQATINAAHAETELVVVPHADPKILDPIWTTAYISRNHGYMIYDTLFSLDANGEIQPQMVDTVTRSNDGKTVTLTLRAGLMWHDNTPVTAQDCVVSIKRWGGKDAMGQKLMSFVENLSANGDRDIVFEMSIPTGLIELALSKPSSNVPFMMPARIAETPSDEQITEYVGSGPYVFNEDEWQPGTRVVYEKFDGYVPRSEPPSGLAGGKVVKVDRVIWTPIRDIQQAVNSLNAGELDIIESVTADVIPLVEDAGTAYIKDPNPPGLQYTARYNVLHPPFDNAKVRQALLYAFNQEDFLEATVGNSEYYTVCKALFGCGLPFETDAHMDGLLESNFTKARELLEEGGYNGEEVLLMHSTNVPVLTNLAPVAKDLMEAIGMNVKMVSMDWSTLVARRSKQAAPADGGWNMFITAWTMGDLINPLTMAFLNSSCEDALFGWPCSDEIEKLRDDFARAGSHEEQMTVVQALQAAWREYPTHIHLGQYASPSALANNVDGYLQGGVPVFWNIAK